MLALVYFGGVTVTQALLRTLTGQEKLPQLVIVASTLLIAALFNPLRRRIQSFIDRRFYRKKYDAGKTMEAFSAKLQRGDESRGTQQRTGGGGKGDDAARPRISVVAPRHSSEGRAGRLAAEGSLTTNHGVVPTIGKMRHVHAWFALRLSSQFDPYTAERL